MGICPECKKEISYLNNYSGIAKWKTGLDKDGCLRYGKPEIVDDYKSEWDCPECLETIASDADRAIQILKGEVKDD